MTNIVEAILGTVDTVVFSSGRSIGGIVPDVTVEEVSRDTTFITNHPVERGATTTDHAFMMPVEVEMRVCWSDSTGQFVGYSQAIYESLQALQTARQPFEAVTGKRVYESMLISSLEVTTDVSSENALMARISLHEIIIVDTQTTPSSVGSASNMANPASNAAPVSAGTQQPAPTSVPSTTFEFG